MCEKILLAIFIASGCFLRADAQTKAETLFYQGITDLANGVTQNAIVNLSEAIRLKPDYADAFANRGAWHNQN